MPSPDLNEWQLDDEINHINNMGSFSIEAQNNTVKDILKMLANYKNRFIDSFNGLSLNDLKKKVRIYEVVEKRINKLNQLNPNKKPYAFYCAHFETDINTNEPCRQDKKSDACRACERTKK